MPQPDSSSISTFTHLRPLVACSRYSTGPSAVTVVAGPNITWPTSTLTSGCALTYSITSRARFPPRALPVAVELEMGEVGPAAGQGPHRRERGGRVAGPPEVVAVDVHGMRQPERVRRVGERLENAPRRHRARPHGIVQAGHVALR